MLVFGTLAILIASELCSCTLESLLNDPEILSFIESHAGIGDNSIDIYSNTRVASGFVEDINRELRQWKNGLATLEWNYSTNITDFNKAQLATMKGRFSRWHYERLTEARRYSTNNMPSNIRRQLDMFRVSATSSNNTISEMSGRLQAAIIGNYSSARACLNNGTCFALKPSLELIMATSRDSQLLAHVWEQWHAASGPPIRRPFSRLIQLLNSSAIENGFSDYSAYEHESTFFDTPHLDSIQASLWHDIKPLYLQLHAYVRRKLREQYGADVVGLDGTIPAHLLGDMWAQHWTPIFELTMPFDEVDAQHQINDRLSSWTVDEMFNNAENFFESLGLSSLPSSFWRNSILVKPRDREFVCHASSMDMFNSDDYRIKMCANPGLADFRTVHHELGHVTYFQAYQNQPTIFRTGANGAFHEAIGDAVQLAALSSTNLVRLGLLNEDDNVDEEQDNDNADQSLTQPLTTSQKKSINALLGMALEKVAFIPFSHALDTWRNEVLKGHTTSNNYNRRWWDLRLINQGIRAPSSRSERDFDPGSKFHVAANVPYASYFLSYVLQFQLLEALCSSSDLNQTTPLHKCDIYGSIAAGRKLRRLLSYGASIPWQDQLLEMTGQRTFSAQALLQYFSPLQQWLEQDNIRHGETVGWQGASISWET